MDKNNLYFSKNIGHLLKSNNLTHEDFANIIGRKKSIVGTYLSGGSLPRVEVLIDIASYFGLSLDDLVGSDLSNSKGAENAIISKSDNISKSTEKAIISNDGKFDGLLDENEKCRKSYPLNDEDDLTLLNESMSTFPLATDRNMVTQHIPLFDLEASAGLVPLFTDTASQKPVDFITIPNLPKCDGAIHVTGDSMYPLLKSGDIVLYKKINDILNNIFWGEMYLVSVDLEGEEYITVKYIQKSEKPDHIKLVSHNQHHSDKEVHIAKVRALAFVKASIRINSMR